MPASTPAPPPAVGTVTTIVGNDTAGYADGVGDAVMFNQPYATALGPGAAFALVADLGNRCLRRVNMSSREVVTLAGRPRSSGTTDGYGSSATFYEPRGIAMDAAGVIALVVRNKCLP